MPEVVELREVTDRRDVIHRAVQRLSAGELVVLPSEAGPVLAMLAVADGSAPKLPECSRGLLLLRSADELLDFVPTISKTGLRIGRRCWPGPLDLRVAIEATNGLLAALSESVRADVIQDNAATFRVSSHPVLSEVAKMVRGPLVLHEIAELPAGHKFDGDAWSEVAMVVLEQQAANSPTTIVRVDADGWLAERIGGVPENRLQVAACEIILFVCTGNTCRSPMAEGLFRQMLADRLKCSPAELVKRGYVVASAGVAADFGYPASPEAVDVLRERGIDLRGHNSQPLSDRLLDHADRCYTLTAGHRRAILSSRPDAASRVEMLARDGKDIPDPIGGGRQEYVQCAAAIDQELKLILNDILPDGLAKPPLG